MDGLHVMILAFKEPFGNEMEEHGWDVEWTIKGLECSPQTLLSSGR
jgi:hypothetical protein